MPLCPVGIAVSKPGRESWLVDEIADSILPRDPGARIERTGFDNVVAIYSEVIPPHELPRLVLRMEQAFLKRLAPVEECVRPGSPGELDRFISGFLASRGVKELQLWVYIRGSGKEIASRGRVERLVRSLGIELGRGATTVFDLESLNEVFTLSLGITRKCGLDCVLILPMKAKHFKPR